MPHIHDDWQVLDEPTPTNIQRQNSAQKPAKTQRGWAPLVLAGALFIAPIFPIGIATGAIGTHWLTSQFEAPAPPPASKAPVAAPAAADHRAVQKEAPEPVAAEPANLSPPDKPAMRPKVEAIQESVQLLQDGSLAIQKGDFDQALTLIHKAQAIHATTEGHMLLGQIHEHKGLIKEAVGHYRAALDGNRDHQDIFDLTYKIGRLMVDSGREAWPGEFRDQSRKVMREARKSLARGNADDALQMAKLSQEMGVGSSSDIVLGQIYQHKGENEKAIEHYNAWLAENSKSKMAQSVANKIQKLGGTVQD